MTKRIAALFLSLVLILSLLAPAVAAPAVPTITIKADLAGANPGDTVTYTLYLEQPDTITAFGFNIDVPVGLTYVANSGTVCAAATNQFGIVTFEPSLLQLSWYSFTGNDFTNTSEIELMSFQCKINDNAASKAYELGLKNVLMAAGSTQGYADISTTVKVVAATVTVTPKPVAVTGITVNPATLSLNLAGTATAKLTATVNPADATNKTVTWSSNDSTIASVDNNGNVTAKKVGTTTITATAGGKSATCTVTVTCSHTGGTATCTAQAICTKCGVAYGAKDPSNHTGTEEWTKTAEKHSKAWNCCGAPTVAETTHNWNNGVCTECSYGCSHTGGTATCLQKATCSICGNTYGDFADHSYTAQEKKPTALKTAGTCKVEAEYYYSCAICHEVENKVTHTFKGDKDPSNHTGTEEWTKTAEKHSKAWSCCGVVTVTETTHNWNNGVCTECSYGCSHTGGTATCVNKATCTICGVSYGTVDKVNGHKPGAWENDGTNHWQVCDNNCGDKLSNGTCTGGTATCVNKATCTTCGKAYGSEDTVNGHKPGAWENDGTNHWQVCDNNCGDKLSNGACTGGTATCVSKATCTTCGKAYGSEDTVNGHNWASSWSNDSSNGTHYKACLNTGCTARNEEDTHSSTGGNVATCVKAAKCDICSVSYGTVDTVNGHKPSASWVNTDASGHWHVCENAGCGEKLSFAAHKDNAHPDGAASEDYAVICSTCGYQIHAMLNHTCVTFTEVVDSKYLVSAATCVSPAVYYKSCVKCGTAGTETFTSGTADTVNGHNWASAWSSDADGHWHACGNGCGTELDAASHGEPVWKYNSSTNKHWSECPTCGYKLTAEAAHVDADNNGVCDTCGGTVRKPGSGGSGHYFHFDYNGDGKCDYCNTCVTHVDKNGDGKCDHCFVESSKTFDAGIALYAGMAVLAATGSAVVIGKKRKEQE